MHMAVLGVLETARDCAPGSESVLSKHIQDVKSWPSHSPSSERPFLRCLRANYLRIVGRGMIFFACVSSFFNSCTLAVRLLWLRTNTFIASSDLPSSYPSWIPRVWCQCGTDVWAGSLDIHLRHVCHKVVVQPWPVSLFMFWLGSTVARWLKSRPGRTQLLWHRVGCFGQ